MGLLKKLATASLVVLLMLVFKELTESGADVPINTRSRFQTTPGAYLHEEKSIDSLREGAYFLHRKILINGNINFHHKAKGTQIKFDHSLGAEGYSYQSNGGTFSSVSDTTKLQQTVMATRHQKIQTTVEPKIKTNPVMTSVQASPRRISSLQPSRGTTIQKRLQNWKSTTRKPFRSSTRKPLKKQNTMVDYEVPAWIHQCSNVYLDLGSNIGVQVRKLFEPERYPIYDQRQKKVMDLFNQEFGDPARRRNAHSELCAFGFEPNPKHSGRLKSLENQYLSKGWKVHFFPFAVSNTDKIVALYTENEPGKNDWGATLYKTKGNFQNSIQVRQVRLVNFVKQFLNRTRINIIKFDMEAAEYEVLLDFLNEGLLCQEYVKLIMVEWHTAYIRTSDPNSVYRNPGIKQWITSQRCNATKVLELADETYMFDNHVGPQVVPPV